MFCDFTLIWPDAEAIFLAGDFNHWSTTATPLHALSEGRWRVRVSLPPGRCRYCFYICKRTEPAPAGVWRPALLLRVHGAGSVVEVDAAVEEAERTWHADSRIGSTSRRFVAERVSA